MDKPWEKQQSELYDMVLIPLNYETPLGDNAATTGTHDQLLFMIIDELRTIASLGKEE